MQFSPSLINLHQRLGNQFQGHENSFFYKNPVFIVSTPRSGSNLLFEQLTTLNHVWSIGAESHGVFAEFPHLRYENQLLDSACLTAVHADPQTAYLFKLALYTALINNNKQSLLQQMDQNSKQNVFLEKTPRNALNIPFLKSIFPHAKFIYLYRKPKQNVASIIEAWKIGLKTGQFATFQNLPDWDRTDWCLLLPRGWKDMNGKSIAEIAYFQWQESNREIMKYLSFMPQSTWTSLSYQDLIEHPYESLKNMLEFMSIETKIKKKKFKKLSHSKTTISAPKKKKWKKHKKAMLPLFNDMNLVYAEIKSFCKK